MANAIELINYQFENCFGEIDFEQLAVSALWNKDLHKIKERSDHQPAAD